MRSDWIDTVFSTKKVLKMSLSIEYLTKSDPPLELNLFLSFHAYLKIAQGFT